MVKPELKIAVVDFSHYEVVDAFVRVLQPVCAELNLIVSEWIAADLRSTGADKAPNVQLHVLPGIGHVPAVHEILVRKDVDLCFFSTIDSEFEGYSAIFSAFNGKKLLVVHNVNFWLAKQRILGLFDVARSPQHRAMLACIAKADAVVVLSGELKAYAFSRYRVGRPIVEFTTCIAREWTGDAPTDDGALHVVIPGQIESKRRDYHAALDSVEMLDRRATEIVLLGRPFDAYGEDVVRRCKLLAADGFKVTWYESYVPQTEFDRQMCGASVILSPVIAGTSFAGVPEQYGASKITGAIPDMIRYRKPGILPGGIPFPDQLRSSVRTYASTDELTEILSGLGGTGVMRGLVEQAENNAAHWELSGVRSRFLAELDSVGITLQPLA